MTEVKCTRSGVLEADEIWDGSVVIEGDVVVPAGRTLRLAPGAQVSFSPRPRWSCSVFRTAPEGYPIEASYRGRCDVIVQGRLEVAGIPEAPVIVGGGPWGGITVLAGGRAKLRSTVLSGAVEYLVQAFDDGRVAFEDARLSGARTGVLAWGLSRVEGSFSVLEGLETAVLAREGSSVSLERVEFVGGARGVCSQQWSLAEARGCVFRSCSASGAAAYERSRFAVRDSAFYGCGEGVLGAGDAEVAVQGCEFWGNRVGVQAIESASIDVRDCRLEASGEQGVKFSQRSTGRLVGCRFTGNRLGIYSEDEARAQLSACDLGDDYPSATAGGGVLADSGGA